jgi:hypothetical protein
LVPNDAYTVSAAALDRSERHQRWLLERGADPDAVTRLVGLADQARGHVVATRTGRPPAKAGKRDNG